MGVSGCLGEGGGGVNPLIYPSVSGSDYIINLVLWDKTILF